MRIVAAALLSLLATTERLLLMIGARYRLLLLVLCALVMGELAAVALEPQTLDSDGRGRGTAVTLNYCRASFHRIRRYQSKRVLIEEQEKILNNLNLNGIGDEEVIKLYSSVLDEIGKVQIAEREVTALHDKFRKGVHRQVGMTALAMGSQLALGSVNGAVRSGVNSWLDYRDLSWTREFDVWKVEKDRMTALVDKSTTFLDTFWKLAQKKNIPDRWLVRGDDLDALEDAVREPDPEKRYRILKRMEPFMECYPPYWYFLARATQMRGEFSQAATIYDRVALLAHGHFRKDDMLAACLANKALIQEHLKLPDSDKSAHDALAYSSSVWEANLLCAQVLEKYGQLQEAEDAILRNLDVDLERPVSSLALVGLYYRNNRKAGLEQLLATDNVVNALPVSAILMCLEKSGLDKAPPAVVKKLRDSLMVTVEARFGLDDVAISCDATWMPQTHKVRLAVPALDGTQQWLDTNAIALVEQRPKMFEVSQSQSTPNLSEKSVAQALGPAEFAIRFKSAIEAGNPLTASAAGLFGASLVFIPTHVADGTPITVTLGNAPTRRGGKHSVWGSAAAPSEINYGKLSVNLASDPATVAVRGAEKKAEATPTVTDGGGKNSDRQKPRARIVDVVPLVEAAADDNDSLPMFEPMPETPTSSKKDGTPPPPEEIEAVRPKSP